VLISGFKFELEIRDTALLWASASLLLPEKDKRRCQIIFYTLAFDKSREG